VLRKIWRNQGFDCWTRRKRLRSCKLYGIPQAIRTSCQETG